MAGNRCIADVVVTCVSENGRPWGGTWGHIERGIHQKILRQTLLHILFALYGGISFLVKKNQSTLIIKGVCKDAE